MSAAARPAASRYCAMLHSSSRRQHVHQVVRHGGTLGGRRLGRADVHAPVQRHRVHGNDLGADPPRQLDADRRLAGGRRAGQKPTIGCKIHAFLRPRATVITRHHRPVRVEQQLVRIGRVAIGQGDDGKVGQLSRFEAARLVRHSPAPRPPGWCPIVAPPRGSTAGCRAASVRISAKRLRSGDDARLSVPNATATPRESIFSSG